jgi:hypothetical protein
LVHIGGRAGQGGREQEDKEDEDKEDEDKEDKEEEEPGKAFGSKVKTWYWSI